MKNQTPEYPDALSRAPCGASLRPLQETLATLSQKRYSYATWATTFRVAGACFLVSAAPELAVVFLRQAKTVQA